MLIRRLRQSGLTFREISKIANVSSGSINAELKEWEKEKAQGLNLTVDGDLPPAEQKAIAQLEAELAKKREAEKNKANALVPVEAEPIQIVRF